MNSVNNVDNIVLIGMPGVGKSTIGVILAKVLGYNFIDTDILIQEKTGKLLFQIIQESGIDDFINIENNVNKELSVEKSVIATGGSVVYGKEAMEHLKSIGKIIYLKQNFERINERVSNINGRGVVLRDNQTFLDLYNERTPLYEKYADIVLDEEDLSIEDTLKKLIYELNK